MKRDYESVERRRAQILKMIREQESVKVDDLAELFQISAMSVRRDLQYLEDRNHITRFYGGARANAEQPAPVNGCAANYRKLLSRYAASKVESGDTIFINSGTTMEVVAAILRSHKNLNVVTNSIKIAMELGSVPTLRVILLGGEINTQYGFTYGSDAQSQLAHYQADWALLTLNGISAEGGMTTYHAEEATLNCMMINQAKHTLVAADHSKVGHAGFFRFGEVAEGLELVTDNKANRQVVAELEAKGLKVSFAEQ